MNKRLYRSKKDKVLAGVGGGLAEYFKIDPTVVRVLMVLVAITAPQVFVVAYIIAAIIMPEMPEDYVPDDVEVLDEEGTPVASGKSRQPDPGVDFHRRWWIYAAEPICKLDRF